MKKFFLNLALLAALSIPASVLAVEVGSTAPGNPVEMLTGEVWQQSKPENKRAWLFGVDTAVAIEKAVDEQMKALNKNPKKKIDTLSPFDKGWMKAFDNMTRDEVINQVDQWYAANPDKVKRTVMDVIWYEIIVPRLAQGK